MTAAPNVASGDAQKTRFRMHVLAGKLLLQCIFIVIAIAAYVAYEHFKIHHQSTQSLASLIAAGVFGFAPVRALAHELFQLEGRILHLIHGTGGIALLGLSLGGVISGGSLLPHAAMAPFAIMGAAQAMMHQTHPRSAAQARALHDFATSLPEVEQFSGSASLTSPANVRRAINVLSDLLAKAQVLGETELQSDPGFQGALRRVTAHYGLGLGLDAVDRVISRLSANPAAASALPGLHKQLARARKTAESL